MTLAIKGRAVRAWGAGLAFVLVFLLLDWVSYIRPFHGLNITPWNPQPALAVALLLWNPRRLGLVAASLLVAELAVRGVPEDWRVTLGAAGALTLSYAAVARGLALRLGPSPALATRRQLAAFAALVALGALLDATVYVATYALAGLGPGGPVHAAVARYWVGDAVGFVVLLPLLLILMDRQRRAALRAGLRNVEAGLVGAAIVVLPVLAFRGDDSEHFKFFYLLFVPVVWAAARFGLAGAVAASALTQCALIVALERLPSGDVVVFELQVLMAALALTGLMLGISVDERERAARELEGSLRLAAAGQMAAALAHELSQPLTALNQYAQSARLLAEAPGRSADERLAGLTAIAARMGDDALRASEVVRRLRDFFRFGSTQLQRVDLPALLAQSVEALRARAQAQGASLTLDAGAGLPQALIDPIQVAVVVRNLVANAIDAATRGRSAGRVEVRAGLARERLLVEVVDDGPGIGADRLQALFEAGPSDKPGGMGMGLSLCRAIVEAHGGALWLQPGPGGHFCLTLPLERAAEEPSVHAA